ncbi:hypothetical protein [Streptomyces sp. DH24]|uniref:hypothetical protein n=1 Tax=Streptomyces sp. DH24 TaxID=3040123 RepID=UPI002441D9A3|nr:hypothetical protein [Streptomyces sp. DH24]MDG9718715.1 hypothetical protein [Streptomyces sp. DH24]
MIPQVSHQASGAAGPAALTLALAVAAGLHPPVPRAAEVAVSPAGPAARGRAKARAENRRRRTARR